MAKEQFMNKFPENRENNREFFKIFTTWNSFLIDDSIYHL
jgi:hypothetical protein